MRYFLENADLPYEIRDGAKWYGAPVEGGGLTAPWDKYGPEGGLVAPAAAKLGDAYNWYTKNIQTPISETLSQVTGSALGSTPGVAATLNLGAGIREKMGLPDWGRVEDPGMSGVMELSAALRESGGNPTAFRDIQNENFAERPAWQQLAASTVYDPLNLVGSGLGAKALSSGALEVQGFSRRYLWRGRKDKRNRCRPNGGAWHCTQTSWHGPSSTGLGGWFSQRRLRQGPRSPRASEPLVAATADDDASLREKLGRAMMFGAIPAVGPEATSLAAKLYGKAPDVPIPFSGGKSLGLAKHGVGRNAVLENAPTAQVLADAGIKAIAHLPEFKESV
ncbi:MAG: hypothetical protein IPL72_07450 [Sulfuritalea sp.]|nr:hypothetical protein [Sulfuritalea sp.]